MMKTRALHELLLLSAAGCFAVLALLGVAQGATLAEDGQPRAAVVVAPGLPGPTAAAVDDLVRIVERMSGARLPVVASAEETDAPARIWVGRHEGLEERFPGVDLSVPKYEEVLLACRGEDVLILGHDQTFNGAVRQAGTSMAVYEFLEKVLDVRWLWPGELGEDVIESPTVRVEEFTYRHAPPRQRQLRIVNHRGGAGSVESYRGPRSREEVETIARQLDQGASDWHRRQRGSNHFRMMQAGHAFGRWWERYSEEHPEFFAQQYDGTRDPFPSPGRAKLCVSNPAVAEQWIENAVEHLEAQPVRLVVSASPNDSALSGKCWCETCRSWDAPDGPPITLSWRNHREEYVSLTDRYVRFWNILARGLRERLPGREAYVGVWAYVCYRHPPLIHTLEPNIMVGYVGWPGEEWQGWARQTEHLFWRPNIFHGSWGMPLLMLRRTGESYAIMADNLAGVDVDSVFHHWATQGLQYYALAQFNWDPRQDAGAVVRDYAERAFGEGAAPHMVAYYDALEEAWAERGRRASGLDRGQVVGVLPEVYNAEFLDEMGGLIGKARAAADGPRAELFRRRLDFAETGLKFVRAQAEAIQAIADMRRGGADTPHIIARAIEATDARDRILDEQMGTFAVSAIHEFHDQNRRRMLPYLGPPDAEYRGLLEPERGVTPLPAEWGFLLDPEGEGADARWFDPQAARNLEWSTIQVTGPWGEQLPRDDPDDPIGSRVYHGVAWYRTDLEAEPAGPGERIWLEFGRVDETCWVYLNGHEIGAQVYDGDKDSDAWRKPRRFDVTDHVREGENDLIVKVQALAGEGGIARPVFLRRAAENLVPNAGFEESMEGWRFVLNADHYENLEERASRGMGLGRFVEERSVEVDLRQAPRRSDAGQPYRPYGQLRRTVSQPLRQGTRYEVRVRYRQSVPGDLEPDNRPLNFRLWGRGDFEAESRDRFWLNSPPQSSSDWEYMVGIFDAPRDYGSFDLTLMFGDGEPGLFYVDEFVVREYR